MQRRSETHKTIGLRESANLRNRAISGLRGFLIFNLLRLALDLLPYGSEVDSATFAIRTVVNDECEIRESQDVCSNLCLKKFFVCPRRTTWMEKRASCWPCWKMPSSVSRKIFLPTSEREKDYTRKLKSGFWRKIAIGVSRLSLFVRP